MVTDAAAPAVTFADVEAAARRIAGHAHVTPVITSRTLNDQVGAALFLKCENLQRAGAFKFRGAFNRLSVLTPEERRRGVVAFSSGNHAQAVALAARDLGTTAVIVLPEDAAPSKAEAVTGYGGEVVTYDRFTGDRVAIAEQLAQQRGLALIPPYEHPQIIAGQGTAALELLEDVDDLDMLIVPVGGGGLIAGVAAYVKQKRPDLRIVGVEPTGAASMSAALAAGEPVSLPQVRTIAHTLAPRRVSRLTLDLCSRYVDEIALVEDADLLDAMRVLWADANLLVEPSGAATLAALYADQVPQAQSAHHAVAVVCGANLDAEPAIGRFIG